MFAGLALAAVVVLALVHPVPRPAAPALAWSSSGTDAADAEGRAAKSGSGPESARGPLVRKNRRTSALQDARDKVARSLVYVAGEVVHPGIYRVTADARVADAVARAGGARPDADLVAVNLAAHLSDGDEIVVPVKGASALETGRRRRSSSTTGAVRGGERASRRDAHARSERHKRSRPRTASSTDDGVPPAGQVDLNTADAETLATVPGIGAGLAERIVAFRAANGPFATVDELLDVSGITDRRLEAILPYVVAR
ncbi:MAG TPA: helix-hairpin-helix domain-containing protein [Candidatus Elarobacter sp.]|nr:helix-hairpin-helix domain-containing protein [Candidatus Elarobacter sp.]